MPVLVDDIVIPDEELRFTFVRSSGPGGQNVNKLATKAVLRWNVAASPSLPGPVRQRFLARYKSKLTREGELVVAGQRFRTQSRNQSDCRERLREMLAAVAAPPKTRRATRPTAGSVRRRLAEKKRRAQRKQNRAAGKGRHDELR
ncbi:MAG: aminoacyl-tRNA hydrolase [Planctomycetia bacterium]|nr:aminoacyl-tRNA hydrolase [Planctomycetia bacterium]